MKQPSQRKKRAGTTRRSSRQSKEKPGQDGSPSEMASYDAELGKAISGLEMSLAEADGWGAEFVRAHGESQDTIAKYAGQWWAVLDPHTALEMMTRDRILNVIRNLKQDIGSFTFRVRLDDPQFFHLGGPNWPSDLRVLVGNNWLFLNTNLLSDEETREYLRTIAPLFTLYGGNPECHLPDVSEYPSLELMHFVRRFLERHGADGLSSTCLNNDRLGQEFRLFLKSAESREVFEAAFPARAMEAGPKAKAKEHKREAETYERQKRDSEMKLDSMTQEERKAKIAEANEQREAWVEVHKEQRRKSQESEERQFRISVGVLIVLGIVAVAAILMWDNEFKDLALVIVAVIAILIFWRRSP